MTLASFEHGRGAPVAVLHGGLGLDHSYLRRGLDALGDRVQLIYLDHLGHGGSDAPADWSAITHDTFVDAIDEERARRGFAAWNVVGHSYGGCLGLVYALRHPRRVTSLVTLGAAWSFAHAEAALGSLAARGRPEAMATFLAAIGGPATSDAHFGETWRAILPLYYHHWSPAFLDEYDAVRYSAAGYNRGAALLGSYDISARVANIRAKTLVISGDDDFIMPPALAGEPLASRIPGARHVTLANCGHMMFHEQPDALRAELAAFFA